jgi:two-component system response regulator HydG
MESQLAHNDRRDRQSQDLVDALLDACSKLGEGISPQVKQQMCRSASICLETSYRTNAGVLDNHLTGNDYAFLVEEIACGGRTQQRALTDKNSTVRLVHFQCPLHGYSANHKSDLCRAASSLLGDIAARNFGYAKVSINKRNLNGSGCCEFVVYLERDNDKRQLGDEYFPAETFTHSLAAGTESCMKARLNTDRSLPQMVAYSSAIKQLLDAVDTIAPTTATVLINGETGVGKELIARRLHDHSDRAAEAFVAINCGAIPQELVDSALFGHEKGAFTGARERHRGYFERAQNGTLFLDEINSLPTATQVRLLRVLQEGEYERVGGHQVLHSNARIIASTNTPLEEAVQRGEFRKDLWFRINIIDLHVPPLREGRENIPQLVEHFLEKLRMKYQKQVYTVSDQVMQQLRDYTWPGNVRELENILERSYLFARGKTLESIQLNAFDIPAPASASVTDPLDQGWQDYKHLLIEQAERTFLERSLQRCQGDVEDVANEMNLTKRSIYLKLCRHGLDPNKYRH